MDSLFNVIRRVWRAIRGIDKPLEPQFKRTYDRSDPVNPRVNGVVILRAKMRQHLTPELIMSAAQQGWMTMENGYILIKGENGFLNYRIEAAPGYYCCFCNASLGGPADAKQHLAELHEGKHSPDPNNPSGYRKDNFFDCVLMESEYRPAPLTTAMSQIGVG